MADKCTIINMLAYDFSLLNQFINRPVNHDRIGFGGLSLGNVCTRVSKKMHTIDQRYLIFENNVNKARNQEII